MSKTQFRIVGNGRGLFKLQFRFKIWFIWCGWEDIGVAENDIEFLREYKKKREDDKYSEWKVIE